jgi:hypothetical protein
MMKIALAVAAAAVALTTAALVTPAKAQGVKMAQVDMQTGRHLDDRDPGYYGERRGHDSNTTVGVGEAVSPSAHDSAAASRLPRLNGTTAAGSRAVSAAATRRRATTKYRRSAAARGAPTR